MCQQAMIVVDCTQEVRLPSCVINGSNRKLKIVRRDPVSADLERVPVSAIKIKRIEQQTGGDSSVAAYIKAVKRLGYLTLSVVHFQGFIDGTIPFPEEWKGSVVNRWYIGVLGDEIEPVGSFQNTPDPMVMVVWWDWMEQRVKWSYTSLVSDGRTSSFFIAIFDGCALSASRKMRLEMESRSKK